MKERVQHEKFPLTNAIIDKIISNAGDILKGVSYLWQEDLDLTVGIC